MEGFDPEMMDVEDLEEYQEFLRQNYMGYEQMMPPDEYEDVRIPLTEMAENCIWPVLLQTVHMAGPLIGMCLVNLFTVMFAGSTRGEDEGVDEEPGLVLHLVCGSCGILVLQLVAHSSMVYIVLSGILLYAVICSLYKIRPGVCGFTASLLTVIYTVACEFLLNPVEWHKIRGAQMVLAMKSISLAFDLDSGKLKMPPGFCAYVGYIFHVGSVIFGPWFSFQDYVNSLLKKENKITAGLVLRCVLSGVASLIAVTYSTCFISWLIMDGSQRWLIAYRDAQSYRTSHYFVCFLSEVTMLASGASLNKASKGEMSVTKPLHIELPRSLVEVVTNWNLPMHYWLKTYVFKNAREFGNFVAILSTYVASSLLHGLNFQLSAVLLSLGFFTYIDYALRNRLSEIFDACIQAKRCKEDCGHMYKADHLLVRFTNLLFGLLSMFHLAHLGLMFDGSASQETGYSMQHTLSKWKELNYASHWIALGSFLFYLLI